MSKAAPQRAAPVPAMPAATGFAGQRPFAPQTKLTVGAPNDRFEQEADRVAEQVMRMPASDDGHALNTPPAPPRIQRLCKECEDELRRAPRSPEPATDGSIAPDVHADVAALRGSGQPLEPATRKFFESRFGHDFSMVRIHTDHRADRSANALNARAYTLGNNIAFASGEYSPGTHGGRQLLAHELTHVVQQGASVQRQAKDARIGRVPQQQIQRWAHAGNCWHPTMRSPQIGQWMHREIQQEMVLLGYLGEVAIPGASWVTPGGGASGRADLLATQPPWLVPAPGTGTYPPFAPPIPNPPTNPPLYARLGEIKPVTDLVNGRHGNAVAQLTHYMLHHDNYYGGALGPNQQPCAAINPTLLAGFPISIWPPQSLMALWPVDGIVYYMCRPMAELSPALAFIVLRTTELLRRLYRMLGEWARWLDQYLPEPAVAAIVFALMVLAVVALVLLVVAIIVLIVLAIIFLLRFIPPLPVPAPVPVLAGAVPVLAAVGIEIPESLLDPLRGVREDGDYGDNTLAGGHNLAPIGELIGRAEGWMAGANPTTVPQEQVDAVIAAAPGVVAGGLRTLAGMDTSFMADAVSGVSSTFERVEWVMRFARQVSGGVTGLASLLGVGGEE